MNGFCCICIVFSQLPELLDQSVSTRLVWLMGQKFNWEKKYQQCKYIFVSIMQIITTLYL